MKKQILTAGIAVLGTTALKAQRLIDKETLQVNNSITLHVGNDITVNKPSSHDFAYICEEKEHVKNQKTSKNTGKGGKWDHSKLKGKSDLEIFNYVVSNATPNKAKSIIGRKMRIIKFKKEDDPKGEKRFYAIVDAKEKTSYKIEIVAAITSGEILIPK